MNNKYEKLFTPFKIGKMEVKNRIVMSAMATASANVDGTLALEEIDYFEERARGGAGMILTGCLFLNERLAQGTVQGLLEHTYVIPRLTALCEAVQRHGARVCAQISCGTGRNAYPPELRGAKPISASAIPAMLDPSLDCHALTIDEIKDIMEQVAASALIVRKAGFDAIEVHAHAGYLIDQFMSPVWNKRDDEYGGTPEKRMRFAVEMVKTIRGVVGPDMPVLFRISCDHRFQGGRTLEESLPLLKILQDAGVDALDVDAGAYESMDYIFPTTYLDDACMNYVCEPARKTVSIPLLNAGNHTPDSALKALESGNTDFVIFGRQLIADPQMPNKLMDGRPEDVRPCIRCNEECVGRILTRSTCISCSVNPVAFAEKRFALRKTDEPRQVVVVGGGPAGLEAARAAAAKGHKVTLFEKQGILGGQVAAAATPSFKLQLNRLITWYEVQLKKLNVDLRLNTEATVDTPELRAADRIIAGTGASPLIPPIPGINGANVVDVISAHLDKTRLKGGNIIVLGGGLSGCDSALEFAMEGKSVTLIEMMDTMARDLMFINAISLFRLLGEYGVKLLPGHKVVSIGPEGVVATTKTGEEVEIKGDTVVVASGMIPNEKSAKSIRDRYLPKTRLVGDCTGIGKVGNAVRAGFYAGDSIA
ncbi:MAG TPA: NAD(P)/FAD-dependent oxidoreductase [Candidatus Saccharimonadales bacterium]|nr:NAD(P)/FAD-dependent oxidoreductase [Candidatus Saccharimonadales bacterium]